jgi:fibro-slime domain-containing protein
LYRDFRYHSPTDFEAAVTGSNTTSVGMVNADLDSDGKPVYTGLTGGGIHVASTATFASWYRNTAGVNHATPSKLALWDNHNGAYVNRHGADGQQWPITETALWCDSVGYELLNADGNRAFINKKLAVDLGGIHTPVQGSVTLDSTTATKLGLTTGNVYEVAVFQAERQTTTSTFKITLSGFNTAPSVCSPN